MKCPKCKSFIDVVASWQLHDNTIRRNRKCRNCGFEVTTVEVPYEYYHANNTLVKDLKEVLKKYTNSNKKQ